MPATDIRAKSRIQLIRALIAPQARISAIRGDYNNRSRVL